jgi:hypothetical protein
MSAKKATQKSAKSTTASGKKAKGYTDEERAAMQDRRVGKLGLKLPEISLGLWHNFGGIAPRERSREIVRRAFELGITSAGRTSR